MFDKRFNELWLGLKVKCNETPPVIDKDVNGERTICKQTVFFQQKRKMCSLMSNLGSCFLVKTSFVTLAIGGDGNGLKELISRLTTD